MRFTSVLFAVMVPTCPAVARDLHLVDLGFKDDSTYVGLDVAVRDGQEALAFSLVSRTNQRAVRLNNCRYPRHRLALEVANIHDPRMRADFEALFRESRYASLPLDQAYPALRALLTRARPECEVPSLSHALRALR